MTFKNENELKAFFMQKCKFAIMQAQNKVYAIIKRALVEFYNDYDPILYERTRQLLYSLVKSEIIQVRNGYRAEVYFDLSSIQYSKPAWQGGNPPSGEQVFEAAKQGLHGAIGDAGAGWKNWKYHYETGDTGVDVWNTPIQEIDAQAIDMIVRELKAQGIPIR